MSKCKEWTLFGARHDVALPEVIAITGGTYNDVRHELAFYSKHSTAWAALAIVRDIPTGEPYADGSQPSRGNREAAMGMFGTYGIHAPKGHYWRRA